MTSGCFFCSLSACIGDDTVFRGGRGGDDGDDGGENWFDLGRHLTGVLRVPVNITIVGLCSPCWYNLALSNDICGACSSLYSYKYVLPGCAWACSTCAGTRRSRSTFSLAQPGVEGSVLPCSLHCGPLLWQSVSRHLMAFNNSRTWARYFSVQITASSDASKRNGWISR